MRNMKNQNIGSRLLRNGADMGQSRTSRDDASNLQDEDNGDQAVTARFMELDGKIGEIAGDKGMIRYVVQDLGSELRK